MAFRLWQSLALAGFAAVAVAQTTATTTAATATGTQSVFDLLIPAYYGPTIQASVVSANPTVTTFFIPCPTDVEANLCSAGYNLIHGPSTVEVHITLEASGDLEKTAQDIACQLNAGDALCTFTYAIGSLSTAGVSTLEQYTSFLEPVTITAGLEKLATKTNGVPRQTQNAMLAGVAVAAVGGVMFM
ncbi:hypothetical protein B0T24DRAFT_679775 [Lasiosphaeria ovina]|uniref:GPI anchored protein n=1 Tax=Lasiosphaeria ovina TaxID=92902 RepID=A0AAE0KEE3_9PEZI|nr:hypothetical protein B0T24DRAFT_679775 [Lasiosphaeria ovina]